MHDTKEDGGPAFPRPGYSPEDLKDRLETRERGELETLPQRGMSVRDFVAAFAMATLVAVNSDPDLDELARLAYQSADAMVRARRRSRKERGKRNEPRRVVENAGPRRQGGRTKPDERDGQAFGEIRPKAGYKSHGPGAGRVGAESL